MQRRVRRWKAEENRTRPLRECDGARNAISSGAIGGPDAAVAPCNSRKWKEAVCVYIHPSVLSANGFSVYASLSPVRGGVV